MAHAELWFVDLEKASSALDALESATPRLSDADNARFAAMTDSAARRNRRLAHIALRALLERKCGPDIRNTPFVVSESGKPALACASVSFSLAHTAASALIALSDVGPVGVDLEHARKVKIPAARRAPIERAAVALAAGVPLAEGDPDTRFLRAWVRIEAVAKATGSGVGPILERLRPRRVPEGADGLAVAAGTSAVVAHDLTMTPGLFAAVALPPGRLLPLVRHLPDRVAALATWIAEGEAAR
ncbi:hypothetical protein W911_16905 [Hyphomicrobium nitrativorans NL23]|uniref:4'-phosphopantetheinyl transferase domain-containing protein n=1 Tax=Hyphomicrobium nitrativorans NL23 TaxID=1029756 RepID=V5SK06_9HYPH|nr:hypothetical protein [Hyphomicrobium nitrativorans]AHB50450.1 hypothetical protein W911_16905 [Hyphomicrobium nitrativorans NL23]